MEQYLYTCHYCGVEYLPRRRNKQKFCSNSCRVKSHLLIKRKKIPPTLALPSEGQTADTITWAGIGNAAIGTAAVDLTKAVFTKEENKAASKKDIAALKELLQKRYQERYIPIYNMNAKWDGSKPYFDNETNSIVYFKTEIPWL